MDDLATAWQAKARETAQSKRLEFQGRWILVKTSWRYAQSTIPSCLPVLTRCIAASPRLRISRGVRKGSEINTPPILAVSLSSRDPSMKGYFIKYSHLRIRGLRSRATQRLRAIRKIHHHRCAPPDLNSPRDSSSGQRSS